MQARKLVLSISLAEAELFFRFLPQEMERQGFAQQAYDVEFGAVSASEPGALVGFDEDIIRLEVSLASHWGGVAFFSALRAWISGRCTRLVVHDLDSDQYQMLASPLGDDERRWFSARISAARGASPGR